MATKFKIAPEIKKVLEAGFKSWGLGFDAPLDAPKGCILHQFKKARGKAIHYFIVAPNGRVVRHHFTPNV